MSNLTIHDEPIDSSGALSLFHAALDELARRYDGFGELSDLSLEELTPPRGIFLVARVDGDLAGGVGVRSIGDAAHLGEVKRLWVRPDLRRSGVAEALMDRVEVRSRQQDFIQLYLETGPAQPEALAFYAKNGWTPVERFPHGAFTDSGAHRFTKVL